MPHLSPHLLILLVSAASAQFPRVCVHNATRPGAICCPPLPSQPSGPACGGPARGKCHPYAIEKSQKPLVPFPFANDDRLDWPTRFFSFGCACEGNFWGYACHRCRPGWTGPACTERDKPRVRRNALTLTAAQKKMFRDVLNRAKTLPSDFAVLNISSSENADPVPYQPPFYNVSVYDYLVYVHVYAARSTLLKQEMVECRGSGLQRFDFAHNGSGFLPWHRFYLTVVETELDDIAKNHFGAKEPFALPYWNWVGRPFCDVCTTDLIGAFNLSDPRGRLDRRSSFYHWRGFCHTTLKRGKCHHCDPTVKEPHLWRLPSHGKLPTQDDLDYTMSLDTYDVFPYNCWANASSFRNVLEGFIDKRNNPNDVPMRSYHMHNLVHRFFVGQVSDVSISPSDPLFWLHHCFVDKLFEVWLSRHNSRVPKMPIYARPGHAGEDVAVPLYPAEKLKTYFVPLSKLGVRFDDDYTFRSWKVPTPREGIGMKKALLKAVKNVWKLLV